MCAAVLLGASELAAATRGGGAPGDRQRKTGEKKEMNTEINFNKSCPRRSSPLGRPVLASPRATSVAKRRRSSERAGALSLENLSNGGADTIPLMVEGHAAMPNDVGSDIVVLPGSKTSARSHLSFAREPGGLGSASS